jgi:hypothetical protein
MERRIEIINFDFALKVFAFNSSSGTFPSLVTDVETLVNNFLFFGSAIVSPFVFRFLHSQIGQ